MLFYNMDINKNSFSKITAPGPMMETFPFHIREYGYFEAGNHYYTQRKDGEGYLLFYTVSGKGRISYEEKDYVLTPGIAVIIDCKRYHKYNSEENWNFYWMQLDGKSAGTYCRLLNGDQLKLIAIRNSAEFIEQYRTLEEYVSVRSIENDIMISNTVSNVLSQLFYEKQHNTAENTMKNRDRLMPVIKYLNDHPAEKITVEHMAKLAFLSKYYFIRCFKESYGQAPYEYLTNLRINNVQKLLCSSDLTLEQIAVKSGFCDSKNLIKNFKKITGKTPNEYRNLHPLYDAGWQVL